MTSLVINWDNSWTSTGINGGSVSGASSSTTSAISNSGKTACVVSVRVQYNGVSTPTPTIGLDCYLLRMVDNSTYETIDDNPWCFHVGYGDNETWRQECDVNCGMISNFKIEVFNQTDISANVWVYYKQGTMDQI